MAKLEPLQLDVLTESDTKGIDEAEKRILGFSKNAVNASNAIAVGFGALATSAIGIAGFGIKMSGDLEAARQGFLALLGSAEAADATMSRIKKEAASTPFELPGLVAGTQALAAITKDGDKAIDMLLNVGKAVAVSGKGQVELDRIVLNLQQISSTGKVTAMDIRQFQGAIPIFNDIVTAAGMTIDQLQTADNAAELLGLAFQAAAEEGGIAAEGFTAQAGTWNQLMSNFKDNLGIIASEFVNQTGIFDAAKVVLGQVVDLMGRIITPETIAKFKEFTAFIEANQGLIPIFAGTLFALLAPALWGVATAAWAALAPILAFAAPIILVGALVAGLYLAFNNNFMGIRDIVNNVVSWFQTYVWPTLSKIFDFIGAYVTLLGQIFTNIFNLVIKPLLALFVGWFNLTFWQPIKGIFDLMTAALNSMGLTWTDVWEGIKSTVSSILGWIVGYVKDSINFVIRAINTMVTGANKVGENIPGFTQMSTLPELATGATNFAGGLALVGERGPEIVNLPRGSDVIPNNRIDQAIGGGGNSIQVNQYIQDPVDLTFAFRELAYIMRTT